MNAVNDKIKICVIDSGIHASFIQNMDSECFCIQTADDGCGFYIDKNANDMIGHGTAIGSIIMQECPQAKIFFIKIFDREIECNVDKMLFALNYIYENIPCDIINISAGFTYMRFYDELNEILTRLVQKHIIIISAFDNNGIVSYPAAFENVLGVSTLPQIKKYYIHEDDVVDIVIPEKYYRVKWRKPENIIIKGSSFACAEICGIVAKMLSENYTFADKKDLKNKLYHYIENWDYISGRSDSSVYSWNRGQHFVAKIHKAVAFPFNKEIHPLAAFEGRLPFEMADYYDLRLNAKCGKKISDIQPHIENNKVLKSFEEIDWESDFDTFILGHCRELSSIIHRDLCFEIIALCKKYQKKLYAFDDISMYDVSDETASGIFFYPSIGPLDCPRHRYSKLRYCTTPIIGIMGTSSKQGKYTLQNALFDELSKKKYNVCAVATEPNGYLLGFGGVFPGGYASTIYLDRADAVTSLNEMIWEVTDHNQKEVLILSGQSGTIPYDNGNIGRLTFFQHDLISSVQMDCCLLCINAYDDLDYIERTIAYINSLSNGKVIALVLFPITYELNTLGYAKKQIRIQEEELSNIKNNIQSKLKLPVFLTQNDISDIADCCINYLSEE